MNIKQIKLAQTALGQKQLGRVKLGFVIPLIVFMGLIVMLFFRLGQPTEIVTNTALERPVPTFQLPLLSDTSRLVTDKQLPTSPYLINVWGSWCPTCVYEHPFFLELKQRGVHTVGVNYKDEIGDALNYLNDLGDPYLMSVQDKSGQFALDLGLTGAPETFVVDSEGIIRQHIVGEVNEENWKGRVEPCLSVLQARATDATVNITEACQ